MASPKPYDFKVGDVVVYNGVDGWSFNHEGDELIVHELIGDNAIGVLACDHPDEKAIPRGNPNFLWFYRKHSFEPFPVKHEEIGSSIEFSLDSVFK